MKNKPSSIKQNATLLRPDPLVRSIRLALLPAGALAAAMIAAPALAAPEGGLVVDGEGTISKPSVLGTVIEQRTQSLSLSWRSFNVGEAEWVNFLQPSSSSVVLNRVLDNNPSQIFGRIDATGQVFVVNPHGILFGASSRINVGGLVASGLDISSEDFMAGNYDLAAHEGAGTIINRGQIFAPNGSVSLVGGQVSNEGLIAAQLGRINLAGAERVFLDFDGDGLIRFEITESLKEAAANGDTAVSNLGSLIAEGGEVVLSASALDGLFATMVNNEGVISASGLTTAGGVVRLIGEGGAVASSGNIEATGERGGRIELLSGDRVRVDGGILDVSGNFGGGTLRIGGGAEGGEGLTRAQETEIRPGVLLRADAVLDGRGGDIVVWSDEYTRFAGHASARGGELGGDGGHIELSGAILNRAGGTVDGRAPAGLGGSLLIDPTNYDIGAAADGANEITYATLQSDLESMGTVTINTSGVAMGGELGDIEFVTAGGVTLTMTRTLTLNAHNDVKFSNAFTATGAALNINANADANAPDTMGGVILGANVDANGGTVTITGNSVSGTGVLSAAAVNFNNVAGPVGTMASVVNLVTTSVVANATGDVYISNESTAATTLSGTAGGVMDYRQNTVNADQPLTIDAALQGVSVTIGNSPSTLMIDSPITATGGAVDVTASDAITIAAGIDVSATSGNVSIESTGGSVTQVENAADAGVIESTTGDVSLTAGGGAVEIDLVQATLGTITIDASTFVGEEMSGGGDAGPTADLIASAIDLTAGAGAIGLSAANPFDVNVGSLTTSSTSGTSWIRNLNAGPVTITGATTTTAGDFIYWPAGGGTVNVTGAINSVGLAQIGFNAAAGTIDIGSSITGGTGVDLDATTGITIGADVTATTGNITIDTGGDVTQGSGTGTVEATVGLIAVGDTTVPVNLNVDDFRAEDGMVGTTDIRVTVSDSILESGDDLGREISGVNVAVGTFILSAGNAIGTITSFLDGTGDRLEVAPGDASQFTTTNADSSIHVGGALAGSINATFDPGGANAGSVIVSYTDGNLTANGTFTINGADNLAFISAFGLTIPDAGFTTTGDLYLSGSVDVVDTSGRDLTLNADTLRFDSGMDGGDTTLTTAIATLRGSVGGASSLDVNESDGLALAGLSHTGSGNLDIGTTTGSITGSGTAPNVSGDGVALRAPAGLINLDTAVSSLAATASGGVTIDNTGGLTIGTVQALAGISNSTMGAITVTTASPLTVSTAVSNMSGGDIVLAAQGSAVTDDLSINAAVSTTGAGLISLYGGHDVNVGATGSVGTDTGNILILGGTDYNGGAIANGHSDGDVRMVTGSTVSSTSGSVTVRAPQDIVIASISTGGAAVFEADYDGPATGLANNLGTLVDDADAAVDVTASSLTATAGGFLTNIGAAIDLDTDVDTLSAAVGTGAGSIDLNNVSASAAVTSLTTANGDVSLVNSVDIVLGAVVAGGTGNTATITATGGAITDGTAVATATNITADIVDLNAMTGIGAAANPLELVTPSLAADTGTGEISLSNAPGADANVTSLTTGGISAISYSQSAGNNLTISDGLAAVNTVISSAGGSISIDGAPDNITISDNISTSGTGTVSILSQVDPDAMTVGAVGDISQGAGTTITAGSDGTAAADIIIGGTGGGVAQSFVADPTSSLVTSAADGTIEIRANRVELGMITASAFPTMTVDNLTLTTDLAFMNAAGITLAADDSITFNDGVDVSNSGDVMLTVSAAGTPGSVTMIDSMDGSSLSSTMGSLTVTANSMTLDQLSAPLAGSMITLDGDAAAGSIGMVNADSMLAADNLVLRNVGDIIVQTTDGGSGMGTLSATTSNGDIIVNHTGALTLAGASITGLPATCLTPTCDIAIAAASPLTLTMDVTNSTGGNIALAAGADNMADNGDDLTTGGFDVLATGGTGTISLFAAEDVLLTGDSVVSTDSTGTILISAGTDATIMGMSTVLSTATATLDSPEAMLAGNVLMDDLSVVRSDDGAITIQGPRNLGISTVNADFGGDMTAGAVTLIADFAGVTGGLGVDDLGAITDTSTAETANVEGGVVSLSAADDGAGNGIGVTGATGDFDFIAQTSLNTSTNAPTVDSDQFLYRPGNTRDTAMGSVLFTLLDAGTADITFGTDFVVGPAPVITGVSDGSADVIANRFDFTNLNGIMGLQTDINTVNGTTGAGTGGLLLINDGDLIIESLTGATVVVLASGSITDGAEVGVSDINASAEVMLNSTATGNGAGISLDTTTAMLRAHATDGGITILNTGALTVPGTLTSITAGVYTAAAVAGVSLDGANTAGDDISIVTSGALTATGVVTNNDGGDIILAADGATATDDLTVNNLISANSFGGLDGDIRVFAGDSIELNDIAGGATANAIIFAGGTGHVELYAGTDYVDGTLPEAAGSLTGTITMDTATAIRTDDLDATGPSIILSAPGSITIAELNADADADRNGAGSAGDVEIVSTTGGLLDGNGAAANITGRYLRISAQTGIGDDSDDIETIIERIAAETEQGDIAIADTDSGGDTTGLTVGDVTGTIDDGDGGTTTVGVTIEDTAATLDSGGDNISLSASSPLTVNSAVTNNDGGNITLTASDDANAVADNLTLNANVSVTGGDAVIDTDGNITLLAGDDIVQAAGVVVSTDASGTIAYTAGTGITNATNTRGGDISMGGMSSTTTDDGTISMTAVRGTDAGPTNAGDITIMNINADANATGDDATATTGDVTLVAGGSILNVTNDALPTAMQADVTGDVLTADAMSGITLDTNITSVDASVSAAGNVDIDEVSGLTLTDVDSFAGDITVDAGATLAGTLIATDVVAGDTGNVSLTTTVAASNIEVTSIVADGDMITLTATASSITNTTNDATATAANADVTALDLVADAALGITLDTNVSTIDASDTATGAIDIDEVDGVTLTDVSTTAGNITVDAAQSGAGTLIATLLTAGGTGDIILTTALASSDIQAGDITADGDMVTLTSTLSAITNTTNDPAATAANADVTAMDLVADAATGITVDTNVSTIDAAVTGIGAIDVDEVDGVTLTDVTTANGNISVDAAQSGMGNLVATLVTAGTDGDIVLSTTSATSNVQAGDVTADGDMITLTATASSITNTTNDATATAANADVTSMNLVATAATGITLDSNVDTIVASVTGTGAIDFDEASGVTLTNVDTVSGDITVDASQETAGDLFALDVHAGTGDAGAMDGSDIMLTTVLAGSGDIIVGDVTANKDVVTLSAAQDILDDDDRSPPNSAAGAELDPETNSNITAATINLTAGTDVVLVGNTGNIGSAVNQPDTGTPAGDPDIPEGYLDIDNMTGMEPVISITTIADSSVYLNFVNGDALSSSFAGGIFPLDLSVVGIGVTDNDFVFNDASFNSGDVSMPNRYDLEVRANDIFFVYDPVVTAMTQNTAEFAEISTLGAVRLTAVGDDNVTNAMPMTMTPDGIADAGTGVIADLDATAPGMTDVSLSADEENAIDVIAGSLVLTAVNGIGVMGGDGSMGLYDPASNTGSAGLNAPNALDIATERLDASSTGGPLVLANRMEFTAGTYDDMTMMQVDPTGRVVIGSITNSSGSNAYQQIDTDNADYDTDEDGMFSNDVTGRPTSATLGSSISSGGSSLINIPGNFTMADSATLTSTGGGSLQVTTGGSQTLASVSTSGSVDLQAGGSIRSVAGTEIAASSLFAQAGADIDIDTNVDVISSSSGTSTTIDEVDAVTLSPVSAGGSILVNAGGTISAVSVTTSFDSDQADITLNAGGDILATLISTGGNAGDVVLSAPSGLISSATAPNAAVIADELTATAQNGIDLDTRIQTALLLDVTSAGALRLREDDGVELVDVRTSNGLIDIDAGGDVIATLVQSLTDNDANDVSIVTTNGDISVQTITAGNVGDLELTATNGAIQRINDSLVTADVLTGTAQDGIDLRSMANSMDLSVTGPGNISIEELDDVVLTDVDTADGSINVNAEGNIVANDVASLGSGDNDDITLDALGNITLDTVSASGLGDVNLIATGTIGLQLPTNPGVSADRLTATAVNGIDLNTAVVSLDGSVTGSGSLRIIEQDAIDLFDVDTANGPLTVEAGGMVRATDVQSLGGGDEDDIRLTGFSFEIDTITALGEADVFISTLPNGGEVDDVDGNSLITADQLTFVSTLGTGVTNPINVAVNNLLIGSNIGSGIIQLNSAGGLTVTDLTNTNGSIILTAGTGAFVNNVSTTGGTDNDDISISTATGDIEIGALSALGDGDITLDSQMGMVFTNGPDALVMADLLTVDAQTEINLATNVNGLNASLNGAGPLLINEVDSINLLDLDSASGSITVNATDQIVANDVQTLGGTNDDSINLNAGSIEVDIITALGDGDVNMTTTGNTITDADLNSLITADELNFTATGAVGAANAPINTAVASIGIGQSNGAGGIFLNEADNITLTSLGNETGDITVTAGGVLTAQSVNATAGNTNITAGNNLLVNDVRGGAVTLQSTTGFVGSTDNTDGVADITADSVNLIGGNGVGRGNVLGIDAPSISGQVDAGGFDITHISSVDAEIVNVDVAAGDVEVDSQRTLGIGSITAGASAVTLISAQGINDLSNDAGSPVSDIVAQSVSLDAGAGIGNSGTLEIDARTVDATARDAIDISGSGNVTLTLRSTLGNVRYVQTQGQVDLMGINADTGSVDLQLLNGAINPLGTPGTPLISAGGSGNVSAVGAIGSLRNPLFVDFAGPLTINIPENTGVSLSNADLGFFDGNFSGLNNLNRKRVFRLTELRDTVGRVQGSFIESIEFAVDESQFQRDLNIFGTQDGGILLPADQLEDDDEEDLI